MKFLLILISFFSLSALADNKIMWKCSPSKEIVDAGFYITLSDATRFPFAEVREMKITGSTKIYNDYLYLVESTDASVLEYRDLYSNGRSLTFIIKAKESTEKGYPAVLNLEKRQLGDLALLSCQKTL